MPAAIPAGQGRIGVPVPTPRVIVDDEAPALIISME
jgi:hypothetical protein